MSEQNSGEFALQSLQGGEPHNVKKESDISYEPGRLLTLDEIKELDSKFVLNTYARMPVAFAYGSGEFLYDAAGTEYIDFLSGIAVTAVGHAQADVVETLQHQADLLWHTSNLFHNQQQALLARALVEINYPGKVFFCNSGTEANEAAFKLMRAWGQQHQPDGKPRTKVIALSNSFHGRSMGSASLTGQGKVHDGFGPLVGDVIHVAANDVEALRAAFDSTVCGMILEPIQGEGGVLPMSEEFMQTARELCDDYEAILTFDEIQTGMGRTGQYFAYQVYGVLPDVLTIAKGLGGGFPIGAMLVAEKYTDVLKPGSHGSTFGGNHLACAVAYEVIRFIEAGHLLENARNMGDFLMSGLEDIASVYDSKVQGCRGIGLLLGLILDEEIEARPLVNKALEKHLVIGRAGDNVLRFAPPLILRQVTAERALERIEELIKDI